MKLGDMKLGKFTGPYWLVHVSSIFQLMFSLACMDCHYKP